MWQRIQTLYLAIGFALILSLFFCNFISYEDVTESGGSITEVLRYRSMRGWLYMALLIITILLQTMSILSFKTRMVQMWLVIFNALILLGLQTLIIIDIVSFIRNASEAGLVYKIGYVTSVFPVIVSILNFLASRNIMLDEAMVQSASRLRRSRRK